MNISFDSFECKQNCVFPRDALHDLALIGTSAVPFTPLPRAALLGHFSPRPVALFRYTKERWAKKRLLATATGMNTDSFVPFNRGRGL